MKKIFIIAVFLCAAMLPALMGADFRRATDINDAYDLTVRVSVSNARGTGAFIGYDSVRDAALILTNYHVVTTNKRATVEFWRDGKPVAFPAEVVWRYYDANMPADFAILAVDAQKVAAIDAPYIALGGADCVPGDGAFFVSAGCPKGSHVWSWKGNFLSSIPTAEFVPAPYPGQSGSGLFEIKNGALWYVGTLTWLVGQEGSDASKGAAIPVSNLYKALQRHSFTDFIETGDEKPFIAPADYTEIAQIVRRYTLIEYTMDDCAPCKEAEKDIANLIDAGVKVDVINVSTQDGSDKADADNVDACPTFILKDKDGKELKRWQGPGNALDIRAYIAANIKIEAEPEPPKTEYIPKYQEDTESAPVVDFRVRTPVRESYGNLDFFNESQRRWNEGKNPPKKEEPKTEPETTPRPKIFNGGGDSTDESKLGDRISGAISNAMARHFQLLIKGIDGYYQAEKVKIEQKADQLVTSFISWFFFILALAIAAGGYINFKIQEFYSKQIIEQLKETESKIKKGLSNGKTANKTATGKAKAKA